MSASRIFITLCVALPTIGYAETQAPTGRKPPVSNAVFSPHQRNVVDASEAARRLEKAKLERTQGIEPLPSESQRAYWLRQEKLRQAVESAQRRANDTHRPLLAQRLPTQPRSTGSLK